MSDIHPDQARRILARSCTDKQWYDTKAEAKRRLRSHSNSKGIHVYRCPFADVVDKPRHFHLGHLPVDPTFLAAVLETLRSEHAEGPT